MSVCVRHRDVVSHAHAETKTLTVKRKADAAALSVGRKVDVEFVMDSAKKILVKAKVSGAAATK